MFITSRIFFICLFKRQSKQNLIEQNKKSARDEDTFKDFDNCSLEKGVIKMIVNFYFLRNQDHENC